nr:MAG TPA: hypothetical protein [Caudoviricetes sp.]
MKHLTKQRGAFGVGIVKIYRVPIVCWKCVCQVRRDDVNMQYCGEVMQGEKRVKWLDNRHKQYFRR